ncbi:hypothetical protein [Anabaena azotica]|uniref:PEP-CTERM sorting domain-containing protein n=1 Tax=Anabaena azotica FACHB-119 TaxID=947527 RepID=A0ABR8CYZ7_9NOST|nr:hypothetical protein [Anabaena azotica]MBD2499376.1 hypothetical protein [Anabaena azotica FACHB-119]
MSFITQFRNIFHAVVTSTATAILVASTSSTAQAAIFTYRYTGVVTQLYGGGQLLPPDADLNGTKVGDQVSGSYSYDDSLAAPGYEGFALLTEFTYIRQQSNGEVDVRTLDNLLGQRTNGIINLETGEFFVGVILREGDPFIRGGVSLQQGVLYSSVQNTAVASTFEPLLASAPENVPEYSSTLALLALSIGAIFLRSRPVY